MTLYTVYREDDWRWVVDQRLPRHISKSLSYKSAWHHHQRAAGLRQKLQGHPVPRCSQHYTAKARRLKKSQMVFSFLLLSFVLLYFLMSVSAELSENGVCKTLHVVVKSSGVA